MFKPYWHKQGGNMIHIDFQGGSHGNYLEFVCNIMSGVSVNGLPFNQFGAAHNKLYTSEKIFYCGHYSYDQTPMAYDKIVSIQFTHDDLLPLQQISLLRAGDYGYDNDQLEINTYHKLNNSNYQWVLDNIVTNFFSNQIQQSYDAVKDVTWPNINTLEDFKNLPTWIQQECLDQHNLQLLELTAASPNCPRHVLREFFQIGFERPEQSGFIARQQHVVYSDQQQVYMFPFGCFYQMDQFLNELDRLAYWAQINYNCQHKIQQVHNEFLMRQPYKNSKSKCDDIIAKIQVGNSVEMPKLDLLEQAYINAKLEMDYFK